MRLLWAAFAGLAIGALAGLACFLIILLIPGPVPVDDDGGAASLVTLLLIADVFTTVGGVGGCLVGLFLGSISYGNSERIHLQFKQNLTKLIGADR